MELYRKKISVTKAKPTPKNRFIRSDRYRYEIYHQKKIKKIIL